MTTATSEAAQGACPSTTSAVYLFHDKPHEELPEVDIPALSQPDDVPSSLLLGLQPDEMTERSRERLESLLDDAPLPADVLRASVGLDVERQLDTARAIEADIARYAPLLRWKGIPKRAQLEAAAELIWTHLNGRLRAARVRTARASPCRG